LNSGETGGAPSGPLGLDGRLRRGPSGELPRLPCAAKEIPRRLPDRRGGAEGVHYPLIHAARGVPTPATPPSHARIRTPHGDPSPTRSGTNDRYLSATSFATFSCAPVECSTEPGIAGRSAQSQDRRDITRPVTVGLIPYWCKDQTGGRKPINAKCETFQPAGPSAI
jgi:hypothetical protein